MIDLIKLIFWNNRIVILLKNYNNSEKSKIMYVIYLDNIYIYIYIYEYKMVINSYHKGENCLIIILRDLRWLWDSVNVKSELGIWF